MKRKAKIFRWTNKDKDFFALFVQVDDVIIEDGLLIKVFEEFFHKLYPNVGIIIWSKFFDILILIHMMIITICLCIT